MSSFIWICKVNSTRGPSALEERQLAFQHLLNDKYSLNETHLQYKIGKHFLSFHTKSKYSISTVHLTFREKVKIRVNNLPPWWPRSAAKQWPHFWLAKNKLFTIYFLQQFGFDFFINPFGYLWKTNSDYERNVSQF